MKAKLIIEDKEIEVEISEEEYKKLQPSEEKKTGYERVPESDIYFYAHSRGYVETDCEDCKDKETIIKALKACSEFLCDECPYKYLEDHNFPLKCIHTLIVDLNYSICKLGLR